MIDLAFIQEYTKLQREMVYDLGQPVTVGLSPLEVACPNCDYTDPDDSSLAVFSGITEPVVVFSGTTCARVVTPTNFKRTCPICKSKGKLLCLNEVVINAMVNFSPTASNDTTGKTIPFTPAGVNYQRIIRIKTDINNKNTVDSAIYFLVNNERYDKLQTPYSRGMGSEEGVVVAYLGST